jgi:hypothetical protein
LAASHAANIGANPTWRYVYLTSNNGGFPPYPEVPEPACPTPPGGLVQVHALYMPPNSVPPNGSGDSRTALRRFWSIATCPAG